MDFWKNFTLRRRILSLLSALVLITVGGGMLMIWYTLRMEKLLTSVIEEDLAIFQAAKGLETALLNQRGYVSYYLLEEDPEWLKELGRYRQEFTERLKEARSIDRSEIEMERLNQIELEYQAYITNKDRVVELYQSGQHEAGSKLHSQVRDHFFRILTLCDEHIDAHAERLNTKLANTSRESTRLRLMAATGISSAVIAGALLSFLLISQILGPIRRLTLEADRRGDSDGSDDEMVALKDRVHDLIEDVDHTHAALEHSRKRLLQSERMAVVGKLAAEVAHSIRNPLTSIKMRLFSLDRTLKLTSTQKEDLDVISDEIRQLENIVQNFLEFSRPPRLKVQKIDVSEIMNMALQLLQKRLERHNVRVTREKRHSLPTIDGDSELLKEVFVNLIVNSCDAMGERGNLIIREEDVVAEHMGRAVRIRIKDTGPGIPESIRDKVMEPFFSTKEDGTGLGLAIAARIVDEHGGQLEFETDEDKGTTFTITLPVQENQA